MSSAPVDVDPERAPPRTARGNDAIVDALERIARDVGRVQQTIVDLVQLEWRRLKFRAADAVFGAGAALLGFKAAVAAAMAGAVLVVLGIRNGAVAFFGGRLGMAWLGDLVAGLVVIGAVFVGVRVVRSRMQRRALDLAPRARADVQARDESKHSDQEAR